MVNSTVSLPTPPNTSEDNIGQDRFNQDVVALLQEILTKLIDLETRIEVLEP